MLNLQGMQEVVLKEKIDFNPKGSFQVSRPGATEERVFFNLFRNSSDDTFNLEARHIGTDLNKVDFNVNNKSFPSSYQPQGSTYKVHSAVMGNPEFAKSQAISAYFSGAYNGDYASVSMFPIITPIDKNIVLKPNTYLHLETLDSVGVQMPIQSSTEPRQVFIDQIDVDVHYTNTYIVPRTFDTVNGNKTLFDIYVDNDNNLDITGDVGYFPGQVTTSATGATKIGLNTIPVKGEDANGLDGTTKVATIDIFDYTYYDYEKKKVVVGFGDDSEKGLRVPYDFSGNFRYISKISPNKPFENMTIMQGEKIQSPLLDPYEGKVRLKIEDTFEEAHDWRIISSDGFERLQDIDPSIQGLERISYEENI